jgi:hypothetical protein
MFSISEPFLFFDYFRVPAAVRERETPVWLDAQNPLSGFGRVTPDEAPRLLLWPQAERLAGEAGAPPPAEHRFGGATLFASVVPDETLRHWLFQTNRDWRPSAAIEDAGGSRVASVWTDESSNLVLPFDPGEVMTNFWSEAYRGGDAARSDLRRLALRAYYFLRPAIPRGLQIAMRQRAAKVQGRQRFPRWPVEPSLHDFYDAIFALLAGLAGEAVPSISPWPHGRSWALVLTHDVETAAGVEKIPLLRELEAARGFRSSWNFVPERYATPDAVLDSLRQQDCEIGVHGLRHDGRDLGSLRILEQRLPTMRAYAERWSAVGFRSPATHRVWDWMPLLGFDYDSSSPDTDPYEPTPGGCCTWLPFFNRDLVELPITVVQDHTLFVILRGEDASAWQQKCDFLRDRGGMAVLLTHPDYAGGGSPLVNAYADLLDRYREDSTVWHVLPRDVAEWWRRRAASSIARRDGAWSVVGPAAADASITFAEPDRDAHVA